MVDISNINLHINFSFFYDNEFLNNKLDGGGIVKNFHLFFLMTFY